MAKKKQAYEIERCLVLSTVHITEHDEKLLANDKREGVISDAYAFGHRVCITENVDAEVVAEGFSAAFAELVMLTRLLKCKWLVLDADGQQRDDLPKFDW